MKFTEQSFEIACLVYATGEVQKETVSGFIAEGTGLGYYYWEMEEAYIVTHLVSGYDIGFHVYFERDVQAWIEAIALLWDWHMSAKDIYAIPDADKRKVGRELIIITDEYTHVTKHAPKALTSKAREYAGVA